MRGPKFSPVDFYYNYAFDLGYSVSPIDAARRLLQTGFARGFQNYINGKQEIADRYRYPTNQYHDFLNARQTILETQSSRSVWPYIRLLMINPATWGPALFRALRQGLSDTNEEVESQDHDSKNRTTDEIAGEVTYSAAKFVKTILGRLAIQEAVDRKLFHEDYLDREPLVRVSLQPFNAIIEEDAIDFDTTITIHRNGIGILSVHGAVTRQLNVDEVVRRGRASLVPIGGCEIPSIILGRYYSLLLGWNKHLQKEFSNDFAAKDRLEYVRLDDIKDGTVLAGLLDAHRYSIIEAVQGKQYKSLDLLHQSLRSQEYFGYPIIFARYSGGENHIKSRHAESLAKLILGFSTSSKLKRDKVGEICSNDLSITERYSLYLTEGCATVIHYDREKEEYLTKINSAEWIHEMFMTTVVIDILILQKMILTIYDSQLGQVTMDEAGLNWLNRLRRELLLALEGYEALGLSHYGSVHDIILSGQKNMRIADRYSSFTERLENIERLVQVVDTKRQSARDQFGRVITTLASAILSLPVAHNIVSVINGWTSVPSQTYPFWIRDLFIRLVEGVKAHPTLATLIFYLAIFVSAFVTIWGQRAVGLFQGRQAATPLPPLARSKPRTPPPVPLKVEVVDQSDAQKEKRKQDGFDSKRKD